MVGFFVPPATRVRPPYTAAMPEPGRRVTESFRIAETLGLRVAGPAALVRPFTRFFGPMRCDHLPSNQLHVTVSPMRELDQTHVFDQSYAGGRWRLGIESFAGDEMHAHASVDRLGRVMVAPAGVGSLLRWMLGRLGFAWLHAAVLTRGDQALVLAGPSGVGKSQLVLRAIRDGWRYVTDDHALLHEQGITGITTPIMLRGYGGWPSGVAQPGTVRLRRWGATLARAVTGRRTNLMVGYTPNPSAMDVCPPPRRRATTVVWLEPGQTTATRGVPADAIAGRLFDGMREAGRYLDDLAHGYRGEACPIDPESFWAQQRGLLNRALVGAACYTATLAQPVDEAASRSLFALLGHGRPAEGVSRG